MLLCILFYFGILCYKNLDCIVGFDVIYFIYVFFAHNLECKDRL